jgi:diacylglycerol kinase (ATP)
VESPTHSNSDLDDLLLVNPAAGGGRAGSVLPKFREFARQLNWGIEICLTQNSVDLATKAQQAAEAGRKRILVLGGDGTFQLLLNAVADYSQTILGVIPSGGGNDLASALGFPLDPLEAAALLLEGYLCRLDVVRVRTADGKARLYAGGGGVGLDAESVRYSNGKYRNIRGRMRYILAAIRALFHFQAMRVRITLSASQSTPLEASALIVAALNTPSYGAGLYLAPSAKIDDGKLELVLLEDLTLAQILSLLPALMFRGELNTNRVQRFTTESVRIETDVPRWFQCDGELVGMTPVEISIIPQAFSVLCAAKKTKHQSP